MKYRRIEERVIASLAGRNKGTIPALQWIKIDDLVIDQEYQRDLLNKGKRNIITIAQSFDWSKFSTVIVAAVGGGRFAIVDGQHRCTAARMCGIEKVPCQIITANRSEQAAAYAAINAVVTQTSSLQIHAAKVIAGEPEAVELNKICLAGGVTICRYPIPASQMKAGQTLAASNLYRCMKRFGSDTLTNALCCITKTRDGNPGMLRAQVILALCVVLDAEPVWQKDSAILIAVMEKFDFKGAFRRARMESATSAFQTALVLSITEHIARKMK